MINVWEAYINSKRIRKCDFWNDTYGRVRNKQGRWYRVWLIMQCIYTNKTGDCLSVCLSVCLFICSAMGGQTARPNRLKFGG